MRRALIVATAILTVVSVRSVSAQGPGDYEHVVEEYRIGDDTTAIRRLARWPESAVTESVRHWARLLRSDQLVAAVMLHTELGAAILDSLPSKTDVQLRHAQLLLDAMTARQDAHGLADAVRRHWYQFVISMYGVNGRLAEAEAHMREALGHFPRDPTLYFLLGTLDELRSTFNAPEPPRLTVSRGRTPSLAARAGRMLEAAAADYRRALELDPRMAAARLHLGWIHVLQDDNRARGDLTGALADAQDDRIRYLAHLFLGGLAERQNRLDEAATEYESAHELGPTHQTPFIALSRVEVARGHTDRSRELARQLAALERMDDDPWWNYHLGTVDEDALTWLRAEAHRR